MKKLLTATLLIGSLILPSVVYGALAYDASTQASYGSGSTISWTHTPVGTPKGIFVGTTEQGTITNDVVSATYGGVAMTKVSQVTVDGGEDGTSVAFYLGSGIPTGAQTVVVTLANSFPGGNIQTYSISITAGAGKNTQLAGIGSATSTTSINPSVTITGIAGASYGFGVLYSGQGAVGGVTAGTGMTMRQQFDFGNDVGSAESGTAENASGDLTIGFSQTSDEAALVGVAVEEADSSAIKTVNGLAKASVKVINNVPIASVKSWNGLP